MGDKYYARPKHIVMDFSMAGFGVMVLFLFEIDVLNLKCCTSLAFIHFLLINITFKIQIVCLQKSSSFYHLILLFFRICLNAPKNEEVVKFTLSHLMIVDNLNQLLIKINRNRLFNYVQEFVSSYFSQQQNKSSMNFSRTNSLEQNNRQEIGLNSHHYSQFTQKTNEGFPRFQKSSTMSNPSSKIKVKTNKLIQNLQKAQALQKQNESQKQNNDQRPHKNVALNMMRLQDKSFNIQKNIFNISIGEIATKQSYLSSLQEQLQILKSKIKKLQDQENNKVKMRTISYANQLSDTSSQQQSRQQPRKSLCGRIYKRASTPSTQKKHAKNLSKQQQSSYYKWRPQIEERPATDLSQNKREEEISSNKRIDDPSNKFSNNYRIKQKNTKQPVSEQSIQEQPEQLKQLFKKNPQWEISNIKEDFRAKMSKKIQIPKGFPIEAPDITDTVQQYEKKSIQIYALFGINSTKFKSKLIVRKFKNGVYYQMKPNKNIVWYFNGSFYIGDWDTDLPSESQKNGFGFQYVPNKYFYLGQFRNGNRNGKGIIKIISKGKENSNSFVSYDGQWLNGKPHGHGKHIDEKNNKYIGDFELGQKTGKAYVLNSDGLYFEGDMKNGSKHGKGVQKLINGDVYIGNFHEGKFNGTGTYKWKNGSYYEGQFANGKRQGKGIWKSYNGDQFEGQYLNDAKNGWGKFTWKNGEIYEGEFKDDIRHGKGFYKHPNGKIGKYIWKDGHIDHRLKQQKQQQQNTENIENGKAQNLI